MWVVDLADEATQAMVRVCIGVWGISGRRGSVSEAATDSDGKGGGDNDAPKSEEEGLPSRSAGGKVAVVVCGNGTPARCVG